MKNKNGSVLIVAMVLGLSLVMMASGYIALTTQSMKHTQRSFYQNTAFNLAESGAEYAVWCLKNTWTLPSGNWTGDAATKMFIGSTAAPMFTDTQGTVGFFKIRVTNANTPNPVVIAEGVVVPKTGRTLTKQIRVNLTNGSLFRNGLVGDEITLNGGELDSYVSSAGSPATAPRGHDITVASTSLEIVDVTIGSPADIFGNVAIAPSSTSSAAFIASIKGEIRGPTTAAGQAGVISSASGALIDTNRIAYDFTHDYPDVTVPPVGGTTIVSTTLPPANSQDLILVGDPTGAITYRYQLNSVSIPNGTTLLVVGPVEFVVATSFSASGNAALTILDGTTTVSTKQGSTWTHTNYTGVGNAKLYMKGNLSISGNGALNAPFKPAALQVYGTLTKAEYASGLRQSVTIGGNGSLTAALYAPNGNIVMNGGGSSGYFAGAMVGKSVRINGSGYRVRYDKDLQDLNAGNAYKVSNWSELVSPADKYNFGVSVNPPTVGSIGG